MFFTWTWTIRNVTSCKPVKRVGKFNVVGLSGRKPKPLPSLARREKRDRERESRNLINNPKCLSCFGGSVGVRSTRLPSEPDYCKGDKSHNKTYQKSKNNFSNFGHSFQVKLIHLCPGCENVLTITILVL